MDARQTSHRQELSLSLLRWLGAQQREQLVDRITLKLKNFDANFEQTIMKHAKINLRKIVDGSVYVTFKK